MKIHKQFIAAAMAVGVMMGSFEAEARSPRTHIPKTHHVETPAIGTVQVGIASIYRAKMEFGGMTMAHPTWAIGTHVKVEKLANGKQECLTVTDHGPWTGHRAADLSRTAANGIGFTGREGLTKVRLTVVDTCRS